jgi:ATP-dependent helicase/nuclease subunit A
MARLFAQPDVDAGPDAVEIMTIHKSKGLEFDSVIVPGLDRLPRAGPKPLFAWKSIAGGRLLLAPIDESGAGEDQTYK